MPRLLQVKNVAEHAKPFLLGPNNLRDHCDVLLHTILTVMRYDEIYRLSIGSVTLAPRTSVEGSSCFWTVAIKNSIYQELT